MRFNLLFYSDCPSFAGCERMLANLMNSEKLKENFSLSFAFRKNKIYQEGLINKLTEKTLQDVKRYPLKIFNLDFLGKVKNKTLRVFLRILSELCLLRYWCVLLNTLTLYFFFKKRQVSILHVNNGGYPAAYSCYSAVFAAKLCGIKSIVYIINNIPASYKSPTRWLDYFLDQFVKKNVNIFISGSQFTRQKISEILVIPPNKVHYIYNGISIVKNELNKESFLEKLGLNKQENQVVIGMIGVGEKRKGHAYLLKALKIVQGNLVNTSAIQPLVLIEGEGPFFADLAAQVEALGLQSTVKFIGRIANIWGLINAIDILVLPSIMNEDLPNVISEAMAYGKAVIATSIAGIPEQITSNESGILIPPRDEFLLADAIILFITTPGLCKVFGQNAYLTFKEKFSVEKAVDHYFEVYKKMLNS
jgi:glycosyltransferase involved in cell wall biosynthesis